MQFLTVEKQHNFPTLTDWQQIKYRHVYIVDKHLWRVWENEIHETQIKAATKYHLHHLLREQKILILTDVLFYLFISSCNFVYGRQIIHKNVVYLTKHMNKLVRNYMDVN